MNLFTEIRSRARYVVGPVIGISAIAYFAYHVVQGERGLFAYLSLQQRVEIKQLESDVIEAERSALARRVKMLNPDSLDPDLLDEQARRMVNFGHPDDAVVLLPENNSRLIKADQ